MNYKLLDEITFEDLIRYTETDESTIAWCQCVGLMPTTRSCCEKEMTLKWRGSKCGKGAFFCCKNSRCKKEVSLKKGTCFEGMRLPIKTVLKFIYLWLFDYCATEKTMFQLKINSASTIVNLKKFCRSICIKYFARNPVILGGRGKIVQINEWLLSNRGHRFGRKTSEQWVFGGVDTETSSCFFVPIKNRTEKALIPIIRKHILPGTTIMSNTGKAYSNLSVFGYKHRTVNHELHFVTPGTGANTNLIQSIWQKVKMKHIQRCGTTRPLLEEYLVEYMWRKRFGYKLHSFITHINEAYSPDSLLKEEAHENQFIFPLNESEFGVNEEVSDNEMDENEVLSHKNQSYPLVIEEDSENEMDENEIISYKNQSDPLVNEEDSKTDENKILSQIIITYPILNEESSDNDIDENEVVSQIDESYNRVKEETCENTIKTGCAS